MTGHISVRFGTSASQLCLILIKNGLCNMINIAVLFNSKVAIFLIINDSSPVTTFDAF